MTIVISGSSGFLGRALVSYLLRKNINIILLVREENKNILNENVKLIRYNNSLTEENVITELKKYSPEVFIHLAWKGTSGEERNQDYQFYYNVSLTIQSVLLASAVGCKQWIGSGSQAEYGIKENKIIEVDETKPVTAYGNAKLFAGRNALELCKQLNILCTWNRIFSLYGPGDKETYFIPYIIKSFNSSIVPALTKCEQEWDYLYVEDAAEAIYHQVISHAAGIYNLCSGQTIPLRGVVELIQKNYPATPQVNFGAIPYSENQIMHLSGSCEKLMKACEWKPKTTIEEGINKTINYYQYHESI